VTLLFDGFLLWGVCRQVAATGYPSVPGRITYSAVQTNSDGDGDTTRAKLRYEYTVQGVAHTGDRLRYNDVSTNDNHAARVVSEHPVGKQVPVFYSPSDPADAVLAPGVQGMDLFLALFLTPFNVIMVGGWVCVRAARRRPGADTPFAGLTVTSQDGRHRIHLYDTRPIFAGATALGLSFVLVFVIGLSAGFHPPLRVMLAVWGLVLGASAVAYSRARPFGFTARELVLDEASRTLEVFRRSRHTPDQVIPAASVQAVTVETSEHRDSDGDVTRSHVPALICTEPDGPARWERLGKWADRGKADAVAAGLRNWLRRCGHEVPELAAPAEGER
jgi:hypothetical protein